VPVVYSLFDDMGMWLRRIWGGRKKERMTDESGTGKKSNLPSREAVKEGHF